MAEIRIENLHKAFGDFVAVRDSSFTINDGEFFVMLGTLGLRQDHDPAHDRRPGDADRREDLPGWRGRHLQARRLSATSPSCSSSSRSIPHMNVRKNISFPLRIQGRPRREIRERTEEVARCCASITC